MFFTPEETPLPENVHAIMIVPGREYLNELEKFDLPKELVHKVPSDGLCGKSDEEKIGFTYEVLDRYIENGVCEDASVREKIDRMHSMNLHKLEPIPAYQRNRKKNDRR